MKIIVASSNAGKIKELQSLLQPFDVELIPQSEKHVSDIEETGKTFIENAILKARYASEQTGLPAIADDSGLIVEALHGRPGIYSARYAGSPSNSKKNIAKVLAELSTIPDEKRQAAFYCALVYFSHPEDPTPIICEGIWRGKILTAPQGDLGFGYDPIFFDPIEKVSAAELPLDKKNKISHRGQALQCLINQLQERWR